MTGDTPTGLPREFQRQLKFHRWMVVIPSQMTVVPADGEEDARQLIADLERHGDVESYVVEAVWDDDGRLMWTQDGTPGIELEEAGEL